MILSNTDDDAVEARLVSVEAALIEATGDRVKLESALDGLGRGDAGASLKQALRRRPDPTAPDTPEIISLRRRFESVQRLENSLVDLDAKVAATLADLESYAADVVEANLTGSASARRHVDSLTRDADALRAAHDELESLFPTIADSTSRGDR